jgi:TRAP-type C4-dicarboxylate transport system permease small subunit
VRAVRRMLDGLYDAAAAVAALCLVGILVVIVAQVGLRWSGRTFPGAAQYAGYLMAAASFLAFAHTLNRGAHIRVGLLLNALGARRHWAEVWCLAVGSVAACYLAWFAVRTVYWSWRLGDVSQGQDRMMLWIVQTPVAVGAVILALCLIDNLVVRLATGRDNVAARDGAAE